MRILVVEDDKDHRDIVSDYLKYQLSHQVTSCADAQKALQLFKRNPFPMVLSDIRMAGMDGIELLRAMKEFPQPISPDVVLITGYGNMDSAIAALRAGAYDYLLKPIDLVELNAVVTRIAEHQSLLKENRELTYHFEEKVEEAISETKSKLNNLQKVYLEILGLGEIGVFSGGMHEVVALAHRFHNDRSVPVLIEGETGTGKEIIARLVHYGKGDATTPFVPINCTAISPNLFESEFFGYEGGAFSGAKQKGQIGKLELAQGGTLFLDEIGEMPLEMQPKLLRVLEEQEFYRVGGIKRITTDVRIVCSSNQSLSKLVYKGVFRKDLFYRLNIGRISIPSLCKRPEAIAPLAKMFLKRFADQKKSRFKTFHKEAFRILENHPWPGNIRELLNAIERVVLLFDDIEVKPKHLYFLDSEMEDTSETQESPLNPEAFVLPSARLNLHDVEAAIIRKALLKFKFNKSKTSEYLGISRSSLTRKAKKYL